MYIYFLCQRYIDLIGLIGEPSPSSFFFFASTSASVSLKENDFTLGTSPKSYQSEFLCAKKPIILSSLNT